MSRTRLPVADPSRLAVFFDYDGTISTRDVGVHLLERVGSPGWRVLEGAYERGEIESRECIAGQWAHLPRDAGLLRSVAGEVPLDPGFGPLAAALHEAGARVTVVSDGFGFHVVDACSALGLAVLTSDADPAAGTISFPNARPDCPRCGGCGTCKLRPVEEAAAAGRTTVMIGDGASDRYAAAAADIVFARRPLFEWCTEQGVAAIRFDHLGEVHAALLGGSGT